MRSYFLLCCFLGPVLVFKGRSRKEQSLRRDSCCSDGEPPFILERRAPAGRRVRCGKSGASQDTVNKIKPRSFKEGWGERLTVSEGTMGFSTLGLASQIAPFPSAGNSSLCCHNQVALWTLPPPFISPSYGLTPLLSGLLWHGCDKAGTLKQDRTNPQKPPKGAAEGSNTQKSNLA